MLVAVSPVEGLSMSMVMKLLATVIGSCVVISLFVGGSGLSKIDSAKSVTAPAVTPSESADGSAEPNVTKSTEPSAPAAEKPSKAPKFKESRKAPKFKPKNVKNSTIESINTYADYLVMFQKIVANFLGNYESAVKGTPVYKSAPPSGIKKEFNKEIKQQKSQYGKFGNAPLLSAKDDLVTFLKDRRDKLKMFTDSLKATLKEEGA